MPEMLISRIIQLFINISVALPACALFSIDFLAHSYRMLYCNFSSFVCSHPELLVRLQPEMGNCFAVRNLLII